MREKTEQVIDREVSQTSLPQEPSLTQIARSEEKQHRDMWRWMRHFFSEDMSPDNHPVIEIQRRATWVGIALIFQALNEIDRRFYLAYVPFLKPWGGMIPFVLVLGSFAAMWMAIFRRARPSTIARKRSRLKCALRSPMLRTARIRRNSRRNTPLSSRKNKSSASRSRR